MRKIALFMSLGLLLALGCGPTAEKPKDKGSPKVVKSDHDDHDHGEGPHKGTIGHLGKYHIEFCVDHGKQEARIYILGDDEKTNLPLAFKDGQMQLTFKGLKETEPTQITLKAEKQKEDPEGKASCYVGTHEKLKVEQEFQGTVTANLDGKNLSGDFKEQPAKK